MMHLQDVESLSRMTSGAAISPEMEREYAIWLKMFHSDGHSGPLGTIGLIALARQFGLGPVASAQPTNINWHNFSQDGSTRVEALFFGSWRPGSFLGFVGEGTLMIRLDDDDCVKECRPGIVRLMEVDTIPAEPVPASLPSIDTMSVDGDIPFEQGPEDDLIVPDVSGSRSAETVWVEVDGDYQEGKLLGGENNDGQVWMKVELPSGKTLMVPESKVQRNEG